MRVYRSFGWVHMRGGEPEKAEPYFRKALELAQSLTGPDSNPTLASTNDLGASIYEQQRYEESIHLLEALRHRMERLFGAEHPYTGALVSNVGLLYTLQGEHERSLALFQQSLSVLRRAYSPSHPSLARIEGHIAVTLAALERHPEAMTYARASIAHFEQSRGRDAADLVAPLVELGAILLELDRPQEASPHLRRAHAIAARNPENLEGNAKALMGLGHLLLSSEKPRQALPYLRSSLEHYRQLKTSDQSLAFLRFLIARAEWETGARAKEEVFADILRAQQLLTARGFEKPHRTVSAWLAAHPGPHRAVRLRMSAARREVVEGA